MSGNFVQAAAATILIRPTRFWPNPATREDNAFQTEAPHRSDHEIAAAAFREVTDVVDRLRAAGVAVHLFEDESSSTPDSVFPNNWFSTHSGGRVALFPMYSPSRQRERRNDVVELLPSGREIVIEASATVLPMDVPTIELSGGSVRCKIAGVHLRPHPAAAADEPPDPSDRHHALAGSR